MDILFFLWIAFIASSIAALSWRASGFTRMNSAEEERRVRWCGKASTFIEK